MHLKIIKSDPRAREKPCLRCGLSLRKLLDAKHCPQCGLSVWLSLNHNDTMDWSNPAWLRAMSIGAAIMAPAQLLALAAYAILMLPTPMPLERRFPIAALIAGIYLILYSCGLLIMSRPERRYPDRLGAYRTFAQIAAIAGVFVGAALCAKGASTFSGGWPIVYPEIPTTLPEGFDPEALEEYGYNHFAPQILGRWWLTLTEFLLAVSAVATFAYLRKLAQRIPNSTVSRMSGYILFLPLIPFLKAFPIIGAFIAYNVIGLVVMFLPLLFYPFTTGLVAWFAFAFHRASINAAEGWAKETVTPAPAHPTA
jgi:hypothetical protein